MGTRQPTLLLTGGSGRLGRQIAELLLARGGHRLIVTTRSPGQLDDLARRGVEVRRMDFDDDVASMARALDGADRVLFISSVAIGRRAEQMAALVAGAKQAGVGHVLYTSATSASPSRDSSIVSDHFWCEQAIIASGIPQGVLVNVNFPDCPPEAVQGIAVQAPAIERKSFLASQAGRPIESAPVTVLGVGETHVPAGLPQSVRAGGADTSAAAGHHCHLLVEFEVV